MAKLHRNAPGSLSGYLLPFVIVSVHLLVVLIGAAYMARTKMTAHGDAGGAAVERARNRGDQLGSRLRW